MSTHTLESMALEMFEEEYARQARESAARRPLRRVPLEHLDVCPVPWVMHDLLKLIEENHAEPVEHLRPCIHRLITEKAFAFGPQMGEIDPALAVDREVELIVRTLERVREHAFRSGRWSEMDQTPAELFVG